MKPYNCLIQIIRDAVQVSLICLIEDGNVSIVKIDEYVIYDKNVIDDWVVIDTSNYKKGHQHFDKLERLAQEQYELEEQEQSAVRGDRIAEWLKDLKGAMVLECEE